MAERDGTETIPRAGTKARVSLFCLSVTSLLWGYQKLLLDHAPHAFDDPMEDMSFAWYVPVFSAYLLWRGRRQVVASVGGPSAWGLALALPCLAIGFLGTRGAQLRLEIVGFVGLLLALAWGFFGTRTLRRVAFPVLFLLFCVPLATFLDVVTVHLRLLATSAASAMLTGFGADVVRCGTMLAAADGSFSVDVAAPCSGLRSLFALLALTAGYAYVTHRTWTARALLFALAVPIALFGNVVRILSICFVAAYFSPGFATGFYHDYSGYVVFAVAISAVLAASAAIGKGERAPSAGEGAEGAGAPSGGASGKVLPAVLAALTVGFMLFQAQTPVPVYPESPAVVLGEIAGYGSEELKATEAEFETLPKDTRILKRAYASGDGRSFVVTAVVGGRSKSSIHRPELCLPAQGFAMRDPRTVRVADRSWRFLTLGRRDGAPQGFAYTFFNQAGYATSSHVRRILRDVWDRSVLNRIDRWVMVTVGTCPADESALKDFLEKLDAAVAAGGVAD